ncbi:hypothetical protein FHX42_003523 [Saccharopolyspora lacisalsi]|uniref:DsrE family protein n=1 Tax=Halosaccharopolyspora lacisalsi TaxID=1000566 RepID=A0A839E324_9PSEU|nr:hypothetical protein [Halosaccharopolyspora lacisalsi]MBA8826147.1 hypothetical protein [Halosaccharopolyspora lacisalsi]
MIFDGAGTKWPSALSGSDHPVHQLYQQVADVISGACGFCAKAFETEQHVHDAGVGTIEEHEGHPSFRNLLVEGHSVLTF